MGGTPTKLAYNTFKPVASFNNPITVNDLQNKLKVIIFKTDNEGSRAFELDTVRPIGGSSTDFELTNENDDLTISMRIVGKTIVAADMSGDNVWVFDLDYDHQNRKDFSKAPGMFYVSIPNVLNDQEGRAIVSFDSNADMLHLYTSADDKYPYAYYPSDGIVDASDAFNCETQADNSATNNEQIAELLVMIAQMEYNNLPMDDARLDPIPQGSITISSWNMFADGTPHPMPGLVMTSRRVAITAQDIDAAGENGVLLCKFNRTPSIEELTMKLRIVYGSSEGCGTTGAQARYDGDNLHFFFSCESAYVNIRISNNSVYVCTNGDNTPHIFDVDFDYQHQRELEVISDTDDVPKYISAPALLIVSAEDLVVNFYNDDDDPPNTSVTLYRNSDTSAIRTFDETTGQFNFTSPLPGLTVLAVVDIIREVLSMEYWNVDSFNVEMALWENQDQDWLPIIRPFNLLTDSTAQLPA